MPILLSCAQLHALKSSLFPENLQYFNEVLHIVTTRQAIRTDEFFAELASGQISSQFCNLLQEPKKGAISNWQRYWLNSFLIAWTLMLHKHRLHLVLSAQNTGLNLSETGKIEGFWINASFTPIERLASETDFLLAYQQLQRFLAPIINVLSQYSGLNARVFWHNAANVLEFSFKLLEKEGIEVATSYQQLFAEKKWGYGWNPFYHPIEYLHFPRLPLPQPVRLRKVCCHKHLIEAEDFCLECPKLKKLSDTEMAAYCARQQLKVSEGIKQR